MADSLLFLALTTYELIRSTTNPDGRDTAGTNPKDGLPQVTTFTVLTTIEKSITKKFKRTSD